jgi:hypothetical protein
VRRSIVKVTRAASESVSLKTVPLGTPGRPPRRAGPGLMVRFLSEMVM